MAGVDLLQEDQSPPRVPLPRGRRKKICGDDVPAVSQETQRADQTERKSTRTSAHAGEFSLYFENFDELSEREEKRKKKSNSYFSIMLNTFRGQ